MTKKYENKIDLYSKSICSNSGRGKDNLVTFNQNKIYDDINKVNSKSLEVFKSE